MPSAILVDLDDTLADDRYAMSCAIAALDRSHGVGRGLRSADLADHWIALTEVHWKRYRDGELTLQEQRRERLRDLLKQPLGEAEADSLFEDYLVHYRNHWRLVPGARRFLERTAGLPKALVTNGEHSQVLSKVAALGLESYFDAILTPEFAGAAKPSPDIFLRALDMLGEKPENSLMVGDSYESDIRPARDLGIATFHVCNRTPGRTVADALNAV